ncbi:hypothetical protein [Parashewanella tropica]|uniref:hypothetical protein n=1 Tax=Parashewanella tropica TaxID=2547970 RepID=UPI0010594C8D|nr:hypothetical protein [Parashewanella tropica]
MSLLKRLLNAVYSNAKLPFIECNVLPEVINAHSGLPSTVEKEHNQVSELNATTSSGNLD